LDFFFCHAFKMLPILAAFNPPYIVTPCALQQFSSTYVLLVSDKMSFCGLVVDLWCISMPFAVIWSMDLVKRLCVVINSF